MRSKAETLRGLVWGAVLPLGITTGCNAPTSLPLDHAVDFSLAIFGAMRCFESDVFLPFGLLASAGSYESPPGIGIVVFALFSIVTVALGRMRMKTEQKRLDVAQRLVEKGFEPPTALLLGPARRDLRKGIVLLCAGLGVMVAGMVVGERHASAAGLVPLFIGVGYFISYRLAAREEGSSR